jgi:hypothetical protein
VVVDTTGIIIKTGQARLQMFGSKQMNVGSYKDDMHKARYVLEKVKRAVKDAKAKADRARTGSIGAFCLPKVETEETDIAAAATLVYEEIVKPEGQEPKRTKKRTKGAKK